MIRHLDEKLKLGEERVLACAWLLALLSCLAGQTASGDSGDAADNSGLALSPALAGLMISTAELEASGAVIGRVTIDNQNVFDLRDPEENKWLYRLMNRVHLITRPKVIRSQLLFDDGSPFSLQAIDESARLLRQNRYIGEASVSVVGVRDGAVDLNVQTEDVWTMKPDLSFGRKGGVNVGGFGLEEHNLLGTGIYVGANAKRTVDRDTASLEFADRNFRGSWYTLSGRLASSSDGFDQQLSLAKPFYSLNTRHSQGARIEVGERIDTLFNLGKPQAEFLHEARYVELFRGWSSGIENGWARRWTTGLVFDEHLFSDVQNSELPESVQTRDRRLLYPFLGVELVEDDFETATNVDQIGRTEDRHLGRRLAARIGYSPANAVSREGAAVFSGNLRQGWRLGESATLLGGLDLSGRYQGGRTANSRVSAFARYHQRQSKRRLFFAQLSLTAGKNLDADNPVMLGGASGLRGYPLRYQSGSASALLTLEQRVFTDWYPLRLFRVGGAVFFDAGKTWGDVPAGGDSLGLLKNVGFGLRLANMRSGVGRVVHFDVAYPLDGPSDLRGVQFLIEAKRGF